MKKRRKKLLEVLELPIDMSGAVSDISLISNREIDMYGCKRIVAYSDTEVELELSDLKVTVCGEDLSLKTFFGKDIKISGTIASLRLEEKRS